MQTIGNMMFQMQPCNTPGSDRGRPELLHLSGDEWRRKPEPGIHRLFFRIRSGTKIGLLTKPRGAALQSCRSTDSRSILRIACNGALQYRYEQHPYTGNGKVSTYFWMNTGKLTATAFNQLSRHRLSIQV